MLWVQVERIHGLPRESGCMPAPLACSASRLLVCARSWVLSLLRSLCTTANIVPHPRADATHEIRRSNILRRTILQGRGSASESRSCTARGLVCFQLI